MKLQPDQLFNNQTKWLCKTIPFKSGKHFSATARPFSSFWFIQKLVLLDSPGEIWQLEQSELQPCVLVKHWRHWLTDGISKNCLMCAGLKIKRQPTSHIIKGQMTPTRESVWLAVWIIAKREQWTMSVCSQLVSVCEWTSLMIYFHKPQRQKHIWHFSFLAVSDNRER